MQIRESAKKLLCIRNIYNKEKGRGIASTVASLDKHGISSSTDFAALAPELTDEECEQLKAYLSAKEDAERKLTERWEAGSIANRLEKANEAIVNGFSVTEEQAIAIYQQMDALAKTLKALGYKKTALLKKGAG